ncbi:toll-like receptor 8 [Clavelina lepadiformis]|uniref:toll-like receptor 8 n=1 Tax=Clavelina lepadiformis TaxID=159417 RepID=UPI004041B8BA
MRWLLIALLKFLLFSCCYSRYPWNPCQKTSTVNGKKFIAVFSSSSNQNYFARKSLAEITSWADRSYTFVECAARGLTEIPQNLPERMEALDLTDNLIKRVKVNDFVSYPKVSLLNMFGNCAFSRRSPSLPPCKEDLYIEPGALQHLLHLKWLGLSNNNLREFPQKLPSSIIGLDIALTKLGDITPQLRDLPNLAILSSSQNCIEKDCPRNFTITRLPSPRFKFLDLSFNNWKRIPRDFLGNKLKALFFGLNPVARLTKDDFLNSTKLELLDLSGMGLTIEESLSVSIENGTFDSLTELKFLNLASNYICFLPDDIFKNNRNLENLYLDHNSLKQAIFEAKFLLNLNKLRHVDLSFNNIRQEKVKPNNFLRLGSSFSSLTSLEIVLFGSERSQIALTAYSLLFHRIDIKSFTSFSNLSHLSTIDISYCKVRYIYPEALSKLRSLNSLRASNNQLTFGTESITTKTFYNLPEKVLKNRFVFTVRFQEVQDKERSSKTTDPECDSSGLFDFSSNQISTISKIKELFSSKATILDFSNNQISEVRSDDLKQLVHLRCIILCKNPVQKIDSPSFNNLSNLRQIYFSNEGNFLDYSFLCYLNPLAEIKLVWKYAKENLNIDLLDWQIKHNCYVRSVVALHIEQNDLKLFFSSDTTLLNFLPDLRKLSLIDCQVSNIFENGFDGLYRLESLDMSHNQLARFPFKAIKRITTLHSLNLNYNNIFELRENLSFLPNLKKFSIAHNNVRFIQPGLFSHRRLQYLDVSYNNIFRLDPSIFGKDILESLLYLDLRGNDLDCSCYIWDSFYHWYTSEASDQTKLPGFFPKCTLEIDEYYGGCVSCQYPLNLRGRPVSLYGFNTSCDLRRQLKYTLAFTIFFIIFIFLGTVTYSKWFKRLIFRKVNEYFRVASLGRSDVSTKNHNNKKAFVFFDHSNDELGDWVDNKLVPHMINGNPSIELLLAGRDIGVGRATTEDLLRLVTTSRKTIVILSGNFCNTSICRFILTALQELQYSAGRDHLIILEWHSEEAACIPESIQRTFNRKFYNFLRFDQTIDDEVMFFETLRTAFASSVELSGIETL